MEIREENTCRRVSGNSLLPVEDASPPSHIAELQLKEGFWATELLRPASKALSCPEVKGNHTPLSAACDYYGRT